jgi:hypothetical protein
MSVPPGGGPNYVTMERNVYKASHQARIGDKKLKSWALWQLRFGGSEIPYAYATINTYNRWEDIDLETDEYLRKANPGKDTAALQQQTQAARQIVRVTLETTRPNVTTTGTIVLKNRGVLYACTAGHDWLWRAGRART